MKKNSVLAFIALTLFTFSTLSYAQTTKSLFKIERNKNANIVQYDARLDADGKINTKNPMDAYWLLYAEDGQREELSTFQKKAYGYSIKDNKDGTFDLKLTAVKDRPLKVLMADGEPKAEIIINGKKSYLSKVYVSAEDGFMGIPKVQYYTLTGNDAETGAEVSEKIDVK